MRLLLFNAIVFIVSTSAQTTSDPTVTSGNSTQGENVLASSIGRFQYEDGEVVVYQKISRPYEFIFGPFPHVEPNLTQCQYNEFSEENELTLVVSLYTTHLLNSVQNYTKTYYDTCHDKYCGFSLVPMKSIRLVEKRHRLFGIKKKYILNSEWQSNTQLRQLIKFTMTTSSMNVCKNLKRSISSNCRLSDFEIQYTLEDQQGAIKTFDITTNYLTATATYNKIKAEFHSNHRDIVALTATDYKNFFDEIMDQITIYIRAAQGYESMQDLVGIEKLLERHLQDKQVRLTNIGDQLWESLYWPSELTRPDQIAKFLRNIIKADATDPNQFRCEFSSSNETMKKNLKEHDKQKLEHFEKLLLEQSQIIKSTPADTDDEVTLNDVKIHYKIAAKNPDNGSQQRKSGLTIIMERSELEKLLQYLSEHIKIGANTITLKPIDVNLIKFDSLKTYRKLSTGSFLIKTRKNIHILPLRCPYEYQPSVTIDDEVEDKRNDGLPNNAVNFTNIIDQLHKKIVTDFNRTIDNAERSQDLREARFLQKIEQIRTQTELIVNRTINSVKQVNPSSSCINNPFSTNASILFAKQFRFFKDNTTNINANANGVSIQSITVLQLSPLKVQVSLNNGLWYQGMVCDDNMNSSVALVSCRSRSGSVVSASFSTMTQDLDNNCEIGFENQRSTYKCDFILDDYACTNDSLSNLAQCNIPHLFNHNCGKHEQVQLTCQ